MKGSSILSGLERVEGLFRTFLPLPASSRPNLHTAWLQRHRLPLNIQKSSLAQRYLDLLGPLAWDRLPERDLERNWGQTTIPYSAFIPACLAKLIEPKRSMADLHDFMTEHPELIELFGFPQPVSNPSAPAPGIKDRLPTARHLTRMLRQMPNSVLQFLLSDTIRLIREELLGQGVQTGDCISLDTKHIIALVKENNPKAYISERYNKNKQPVGDPDCKLGCKRRHNRRPAGSEAESAEGQAPGKSVGEFYWGYGSGIIITKAPGWGEFVLAEMTQPFDKADATYFFPLMAQVEERLGFRPRWGTFDSAFDAWYVYAYFHRDDDPEAFAAVPFGEKGGYKVTDRSFSPEGLPLCAAQLAMPLKFVFTDRTRCLIEHERGKYGCPLQYPEKSRKQCPKKHKNWNKGGCTVDMPTSIGARLRYTLDRESKAFKQIYNQRSATERINSQAVDLGIERPDLRNGKAIANQNTLIYILINARMLQRIRTGS